MDWASRNRTTVGLKALGDKFGELGVETSQSHHSGIERTFHNIFATISLQSQSHHSGIERISTITSVTMATLSQSHHSGIESLCAFIAQQNQFTSQSHHSGIERISSSFCLTICATSQSHHSGIESSFRNNIAVKNAYCRNRTTVGLKDGWFTDEVIEDRTSQSHHSGIERFWSSIQPTP